MRAPSSWPLLLPLIGLSLASAWGTEDHTLTVYQALSIPAADTIIAPVTYITWYGAEQETTLSALCWPAVIGTPHEEMATVDRNWGSLLGITSTLAQREEGWRLTLDLTKLKPVPELGEVDESDKELRVMVLEAIFEAAGKNLLAVGVFDCELSVLGEGAHEDLKALTIPKTLNPVAAVWGPWTYEALRKKYPDGDLHELAALSLTQPQSLQTLFVILSSETQSAEGTKAMHQFLLEVLARVGDDEFAQALDTSETLVQESIAKALGKDGIRLFPKTAAFVEKTSSAKKE
jgi:hypothetical protein